MASVLGVTGLFRALEHDSNSDAAARNQHVVVKLALEEARASPEVSEGPEHREGSGAWVLASQQAAFRVTGRQSLKPHSCTYLQPPLEASRKKVEFKELRNLKLQVGTVEVWFIL